MWVVKAVSLCITLNLPKEQGSKFTVANVQFATGLRTFAPKKNNLGANLLLQLLAHFHNKYIFCSLLDHIYS